MFKKFLIIISSTFLTIISLLFVIVIMVFSTRRGFLPQESYAEGTYKLYKILDYDNEEYKDISKNKYLASLGKDSKIIHENKMELISNGQISETLTIHYDFYDGAHMVKVTNANNYIVGYISSFEKNYNQKQKDYIVMFIKDNDNKLAKVFFKYVGKEK